MFRCFFFRMNFRFILCMLLPLASPMVREKRLYGLMQLIWYWYWNLYGLVQLISNIVRACRSVSLAKSSKMPKTTWAGMSLISFCLTIVNGPLIVCIAGCPSCQHLRSVSQLERQTCCCEQDVVWWNQQLRKDVVLWCWCCLVMLMLSLVHLHHLHTIW